MLAALAQVEGPASAILRRFSVATEQIDEALRQINGGSGVSQGEGNTSVVVDLIAAAKRDDWASHLRAPAALRELVNILLQRRRNSAIDRRRAGFRAALARRGAGASSRRATSCRAAWRAVSGRSTGRDAGNPETNIEMALRVAMAASCWCPISALFFGGSAFPGYAEAGMGIRTALTDRRLR